MPKMANLLPADLNYLTLTRNIKYISYNTSIKLNLKKIKFGDSIMKWIKIGIFTTTFKYKTIHLAIPTLHYRKPKKLRHTHIGTPLQH